MKRLVWCLALFAACSENGFNDVGHHNTVADTDTGVAVDTDPVVDTSQPIDTGNPDTTDTTDTTDTQPPPPPGEPIAVAGPDAQVNPPICSGTVLLCGGANRQNLLDGVASYDPSGLSITAYKWTLVSKPSDSTALLLQATRQQPTLFFDVAGSYTLNLTVQNSAGIWDSTPDSITIEAVPSHDFYVQLTWDAAADLDLHLIRNGGALYDNTNDVSYCHKQADWGVPNVTTDNPSLDWDNISGYGPETTSIAAPAPGTYAVNVVYYGLNGFPSCEDQSGNSVSCPRANATIKVYFDGNQVAQYTHALTESSQVWYVTDIDWPSLARHDHDSIFVTTDSGCH